MEKIISFRNHILDKSFNDIRITTNKSCASFQIKKEITDEELKIIYKELANMLIDINPVFYTDILPFYMNYVINYCCIEKIPITKEVYIEQLSILKQYIDELCNYKLDQQLIAEEQDKLTNLM